MKLNQLTLLFVAAGLGSSVFAESEQALERVVVTGSSIKRVNAETASPLVVVTAADIEAMGAGTLQQVLENLTVARPAQQDFRSIFTSSSGGSQANLRGLGAQGTLILLNGRRLSSYGAPAGFQTQYVNIDTIPAAAIERMEVLTDGASAIYGSDAVAGVINIITKKSYQGLQLEAKTAQSQMVKSFGEHQVNANFGFGDMVVDGFNVFGSINLFRRDRIPFSGTYLLRPDHFYVNNPNFITNLRINEGSGPNDFNPGTLFVFDPKNVRTSMAAPGCNNVVASGVNTSCVVNALPNQLDIVPSSDRASVYLAGRYAVDSKTEAFAELALSQVDFKGGIGPRSFNTGTTINWFSRNTGTKLNTFIWPFLGPNHEYAAKLSPDLKSKMGGAAGLTYLFSDARADAGVRNTDQSHRALVGLRGTIFGDWDYETALSLAGAKSVASQSVNISVAGVQKAFGPFTVDPVTKRTYISDQSAFKFGVSNEQNSALLREMFPMWESPSKTQLITLDGKIEGKLASLPAGDVRAAFGYSLVRESFDSPGNADAANGLITQQGGSWFDGKRTVGAVFAETIVPITKALELNTAVRLDKYPHFAANLAPKLGLKFRAMPELLLRGTYSHGFRAPNLAESGEGGVFAQAGGINDAIRCDETNAIANRLMASVSKADRDLGSSLLNSNCSINIAGITPPNKELKPEKAEIGTLGMVFQLTKDFDVSADYWIVQRKNEISRQGFQEVYNQYAEQFGPTLNGAPGVIRNPITDTDRSNVAAVAAMCANPANAAACQGGALGYSVGLLAGMSNNYVNRGRTMVDGFDVDAQARFSLRDFGRVRLGFTATIMNRDIFDFGAGDGYGGNSVGYYGNPKIRATFAASWYYKEFGSTLFVNYTGKTKWATEEFDAQANNPTTCKANGVALPSDLCGGSPALYSLSLGFTWAPTKNLNFGLNIRNALNTKPHYDPFGPEGYNTAQNLFGRIYSVSANYKVW